MRIMKTPRLIFAAAILSLAMGSYGRSQDDTHHQHWMVSLKSVGGCNSQSGDAGPEYYFRQRDADGSWRARELPDFLSSQVQDVPTIFFVHGNPTPLFRVHEMGRQMWQLLEREAEGRPFRLVVWAWPDDRKMNRRTAQYEASRSDVQGYGLARLVEQANLDAPTSYIGYSFGARVVASALELLAGGQVAGRQLDAPAARLRGARVMLLGAALEDYWLAPGYRYGRALDMVERMVVTTNACDPAMRFYGLIYRGPGPNAVGRFGPTCLNRLGEARDKLEVIDLSCSVGKNHDWYLYMSALGFLSRLGWYTYLAPTNVRPQEPDLVVDDAPELTGPR